MENYPTQRAAAAMQDTSWSTSSVHGELEAHVTYWGCRPGVLESKDKRWASSVTSHVTTTTTRGGGAPISPNTCTKNSGGEPSCTLSTSIGCPQRGILAALEKSDVALLADIVVGCFTAVRQDCRHLLLEFSFSRTEAGSPPKWPSVALKILPTDWESVAKEETFPWAMILSEESKLESELLLGSKANLFTQSPTTSGTHACHIVARGPECQMSQEVRDFLFQAISDRGMNYLAGTAHAYSPATTDGKHSFCDSIDGVGLINLKKGMGVWVGIVDAGEHRSFRATVVAQKGRAVTVYDGVAEVEIDLLFERVQLDTFWRYNRAIKSFEQVREDFLYEPTHSKSTEPGQLSKYRKPFSPWKLSEGKQLRSLQDCGVSIGWLENFISNSDLETYSSFDVADRIVKPATADKQCRYVATLPDTEVGRATYFVSHRWGAHFPSMVRSIVRYHHTHGRMSVSPRQPAFVWLDLFAVNQHAKADDLKLIGDVVEGTKQTLLCVDVECKVLTRLWCVYEVWQTLLKGMGRPSVETPAVETLTLKVLACGDESEDRAEAQRRISELWMSLSTQQAVTGREADSKRLRNAIREVVDPISLDLQIMSALCNTGDYALDRKSSVIRPPWATAEAGAAFGIDPCDERVNGLFRQLNELNSK